MFYLGALNDEDKEKLDGKTTVYTKIGDLKTGATCDALSVEKETGNAAMVYYNEQAPVFVNGDTFDYNTFYPKSLHGKGEWNNYVNLGNPIEYIKSLTYPSCFVCYPIIICQKAFKF